MATPGTPAVPPLGFGALLKRERRRAGLTQAALAERAGYSVSYISMLERGERLPLSATAELLAAALAEALRLEGLERAALLAAFRHAATADLTSRDAEREAETSPGPRGGVAPPAWPVGGFLGAAPEGPLVAREEELERLEVALAAVRGGAGRMIALAGEPGIGKTRLAQELARRARAQGLLVATGRCYESQQTIAFAPFIEALGLLYAAAPADVRAALPQRWPEVLRLLPEPPELALPPAPASGRDGQQRLLWQVTGFVRAAAATQPVALLLDDLHWADEASLGLLQHLARQTRGARVLLVGTARDNELRRQPALRAAQHELEREHLLERVAVRAFAAGETAALAGALLGSTGAVADELIEQVQRATAGNAFFVQEVLRLLRQRDDLVLQAGEWRRRAHGELVVPETVHEAVVARVGRLSPGAQAVVQEASVLGQVFSLHALQGIGGRPETEVGEALEMAWAAGLIFEAREAGDFRARYSFSHAIVQRAIYDETPLPRRRRLHLAAGTSLEGLPPGQLAARAAELAWHFLEGDAVERALPYLIQAGDQAEATFAHAEARRAYRLAIELAREVGDQAREAGALERLAVACDRSAHYEEAIAAALQAVSLWRALGDPERFALATMNLWRACDRAGRQDDRRGARTACGGLPGSRGR